MVVFHFFFFCCGRMRGARFSRSGTTTAGRDRGGPLSEGRHVVVEAQRSPEEARPLSRQRTAEGTREVASGQRICAIRGSAARCVHRVMRYAATTTPAPFSLLQYDMTPVLITRCAPSSSQISSFFHRRRVTSDWKNLSFLNRKCRISGTRIVPAKCVIFRTDSDVFRVILH